MRNLCWILSRRSSCVIDAPPQIVHPYSSTDRTLPKKAVRIGLQYQHASYAIDSSYWKSSQGLTESSWQSSWYTNCGAKKVRFVFLWSMRHAFSYDADDGVITETRSSVILFRIIYLSQLEYNIIDDAKNANTTIRFTYNSDAAHDIIMFLANHQIWLVFS